MSFKLITPSPAETKRLGESLAKDILEKGPQKRALVIGLIGDLGGGKTTFLQGFAKELGIRNRILSPTFVIMKKYKIQDTKYKIQDTRYKVFYHIDCYRIESPKEILDLGFADMIKNPENIIAIEWADMIKKLLPKRCLILRFKFLDRNKRMVRISGYSFLDSIAV